MQQSSLPKAADGAKQWLSRAAAESRPEGPDAARQWRTRGLVAFGVVACYVLIAVVTALGFNQVYTASWMAGRIVWLFAPVGVLLAVAGLLRAAGWSVVGYVASVLIGEMIGTPIYTFQHDYLQARMDDPAFVQDWTPIQPAWWIALGLFIYITAAAAIVEWRELGRDASASTPDE